MIATSGCVGAGMRLPDDFTKLHLRMNGIGTAFRDLKGNAISVYGGAIQNSDSPIFLGNSGKFDGSGDYLTVPANAYVFGASNFTIEFHVIFASVSGIQTVIMNQSAYDAGLYQVTFNGTNNQWEFNFGASSQADGWYSQYRSPDGLGISTGTRYSIAFQRVGTTASLYINGASVALSVASGFNEFGSVTLGTPTLVSLIGGYRYKGSTISQYLNGFISELRISVGIARYTAASPRQTRRM